MNPYSPAWPHGDIKEVFPNIYFVMGTNITTHEGVELQHSRNMVIIKENDKLTLVNTVRLTQEGLDKLDKLGKVSNIVRIGAFHGRDDAFYLDKYAARLWALKGMQHEHSKITDIALEPHGEMPLSHCTLFVFESARYPEGILHLNQEGGILITCDSIKNWRQTDPFFSLATSTLYQSLGFFGEATISQVWQQACQVKASDYEKLKNLAYKHLISAHGEPLLDNADEKVRASIDAILQAL